jgi:hypothetical protein
MDRAEMIDLIRPGVPATTGAWADLGAGTGNFTWALRELLAPTGTIYAVDRDGKAIRRQRELLAEAGAGVVPVQADFTRPLDPALFPGRRLPPLDGVLMANALHFVRDQAAALGLVAGYLRAPAPATGQTGGRVLLVEYDLRAPIAWVPFPVPLERFRELAAIAGLSEPELVGRRVSPSSGIAMYAAVAVKIEGPDPR